MMEWISVADRLPEEHIKVLIIENDGLCSIEVAEMFCGRFYDSYDNEVCNVTHWMPLPAPPVL